ncbi:hypothetical protein VR41_13510 [Streptomyces sp. NRRL B-1568]|nr:hypothetical protein VR41_13510 [Streptomyces sp. NRRL B-1568]
MGIKVQYSGMDHTASGIRTAAGVVQQELDTLWKAVQDVTDGWHGEAQQMMAAAKLQWDARAQHIQETLKNVADAVEAGSGSYRHTDRKAAGYFG